MFKYILSIFFCCGVIGQLSAIDTAGWQPVFAEKHTFTIPAAEQPVVHTLDIPAVAPKAGHRVIMYFDARMLSSQRVGWNNWLAIAVNGMQLGENTLNGSLRIINRSTELKYKKSRTRGMWEQRGKYNGILVYFAPYRYKDISPNALTDREEKYFYALDVTDVIKNTPNKIEFFNLLPVKQANMPLGIKDLQFFYVPENSIKLPAPRPYAPEGYVPMTNNRVAFKIPAGTKEINSYSFELPAVTPRKGYGVVLVFDCRLLAKYANGWSPWYSISINGKSVTQKNSSDMPRLLRRGEIMKTMLKDEPWWLRRGPHNCIQAFFGKEDSLDIDKRIRVAREEKFRYCIDVTDIVNYQIIGADDRVEGGEANKITFYNHLPKHIADLAVSVKELHLCYVREADIVKQSGFVLASYKPFKPAAALQMPNAQVAVGSNGGMSINVGGETHYLESMFSYSAVPTMKFNNFSVAAADNDKGWSVTVKQVNANTVSIIGKGREYIVERTIRNAGHRLNVSDKITNISKHDIGMAFYQSVARSGIQIGNGSRLAGQSENTQPGHFARTNPTAFSAGVNGGIGLVAEDTISRQLIDMRKVGNFVRMGSNGMGFAPGKSKTLHWAIYPTSSNDYFAFINQVRKDWRVNYTVPGPYSHQDWTYIHAAAPYKPLPPWFGYSEGAELTKEQYIETVKKEMAKYRKLNKNVKFIGMLETNLVSFDCSKVPWGEQLKPRRGPRNQAYVKYGMPMSKDLTAKVDAINHYRDSFIRAEDGCIMYENFYDEYPFVTLMVQPEIGNRRFNAIMEDVNFLMDDLKMAGIYFDQFQPFTIGGASENRWDGHTVALDESGKISRKRYNYGITGASARAAIIKHIIGKGGIIVVNGQSTSEEEQSLGMIAFQEMENDTIDFRQFLNSMPPELPWQVMSHLGSPVALGARPNRYSKKQENIRPQLQTKSIITALRNGLLHYHYHFSISTKPGLNYGSLAITDNMFPFTPKALHEGWIEGEERTITAITGDYTVAGKKAPKVMLFDKNGFEKPHDFKVSGTAGAWQIKVKLDDWNEVAIIKVQN